MSTQRLTCHKSSSSSPYALQNKKAAGLNAARRLIDCSSIIKPERYFVNSVQLLLQAIVA
jgi:hypothetical protein